MSNIRIATLAVVLGSLAGSAHATFYTSEASFLAAINATYYLEDFSGMTYGNPLDGSQTSWVAPGANGYGFTASATNALYSNTSAISTNNANEPLTLTFSGLPVSAFGANLANSDISGAFLAGTQTLTISNGDTQNVVTLTPSESFIGWVGSTASPITSISVQSTSGVTNNWINLDHAYVGAAAPVPEPASMLALGLGLAAAARKRKSK
jgi:hypothetical protein